MTETPACEADPSDAGSHFVESPAVTESSEKVGEEEKCDLFYCTAEQMHGLQQENELIPRKYRAILRTKSLTGLYYT